MITEEEEAAKLKAIEEIKAREAERSKARGERKDQAEKAATRGRDVLFVESVDKAEPKAKITLDDLPLDDEPKQAKSEQKTEEAKPKPDVAEKPKPVAAALIKISGRWESKPGPQWAAVLTPPMFDPKDLAKVPGLVGDFAAWTNATSQLPQPLHAVGAGLVTVGTLVGSRAAGPTNAGTALYIVPIAASSSGKQNPSSRSRAAMIESGAPREILSDDCRSSNGIINSLKRHPVLLSHIDEYGMFLQRILKASAGGFEADIIKVMQHLWGLNFEWFVTPSSAHEMAELIFAPSLSIFGPTTPGSFFKAMTLAQVDGGLLNRHLALLGDDHPLWQNPQLNRIPPLLVPRLKALYRRRPGQLSMAEILDRKKDDPKPGPQQFEPEIRIGWDSLEAESIFSELARLPLAEPDGMKRNLLGRLAEMAVRVATIVAVGRGSHTIHELDMLWARALVMLSFETMHKGLLENMEDPHTHFALYRKVQSLIKDKGGWISHRDLVRATVSFTKNGTDLDVVCRKLIQAEIMKEANRGPGPKGGRPSAGYELIKLEPAND